MAKSTQGVPVTQGKPRKPAKPKEPKVDQPATGLTAEQLLKPLSMADWLKSKRKRKK